MTQLTRWPCVGVLWHNPQILDGETYSALTCVCGDCDVPVAKSDIVRCTNASCRGCHSLVLYAIFTRACRITFEYRTTYAQARVATPGQVEMIEQASLRACLAALPGYLGTSQSSADVHTRADAHAARFPAGCPQCSAGGIVESGEDECPFLECDAGHSFCRVCRCAAHSGMTW